MLCSWKCDAMRAAARRARAGQTGGADLMPEHEHLGETWGNGERREVPPEAGDGLLLLCQRAQPHQHLPHTRQQSRAPHINLFENIVEFTNFSFQYGNINH